MRHTTTESSAAQNRRPATRSAVRSAERWGGFLLTSRGARIVHAKLTGCLSPVTLRKLERRLGSLRAENSTCFLLLDASDLRHVPVDVAAVLGEWERRWRNRGVVAIWIGLSRYLANLLVLACRSEEQLPALPDLASARERIHALEGVPASVARARLQMCTALLH